MAVQEIYIQLVVGYPDDPKVRALARFGSPDAGLARDLYVQMCLYCKSTLSDGYVPAEQVGLLVYPAPLECGEQLAKQLASVGLINEEAGGWNVLAYLKRNRSRTEVEQLSKVRAEAGRTGGMKPRRSAGQRGRKATAKQVASNVEANTPPETETETKTKTKTEDLLFGVASDASPSTRRGTRIPDDFHVTAEMVTWARQNCPHVNGARETEKFINYWTAKAGQGAVKKDWPATWRNWMLTAAERTPTNGNSNGNGPRSTTNDRVNQALAAGERVQAELDARGIA